MRINDDCVHHFQLNAALMNNMVVKILLFDWSMRFYLAIAKVTSDKFVELFSSINVFNSYSKGMTHQFSIKDLENYTGIKAHTIRIWEQRYGLLKPTRSDSNIRKYSDDELKTLLNVSLLNQRGHKISEIAGLDSDSVNELITKYSATDQNDDALIATLKLAMLNFDEKLFCSVVDLRIESNGLEHTFLNVLVPFLREIGMLWRTNTICPAQEHFISNLITQKLFFHINKLGVREAKVESPTYVLYLPEMEFHEISLIMLNYIFRSRGFHTIYLGQSVPVEDLYQVYSRVGVVHFVSVFTTQPAQVLLDSYFQKLAISFRETGCTFNLAGSVLKDRKSQEVGVFYFHDNIQVLVDVILA